jgi:CDP-diacylglycerol--serine O-phosphatidyltransferase
MAWEEKDFTKGYFRFLLPILMIFLSWMMVSEVKYPSFKSLDLRATKNFHKSLLAILFIGSIVILREKILVFILPLIFTAYLIYGFIRPKISRKIRREIEQEADDDEEWSGSDS